MKVANPSLLPGDYAITASALCAIAYLNTKDKVHREVIRDAVAGSYASRYNPYQPEDPVLNPVRTMMQVNVVWGPEYHPASGHDTDSLMYIAQVAGTNEYFVVIRGTNPDSVVSWIFEDFEVDVIKQLDELPGWPANLDPGSNCMIAKGSFNGVSDLIGLIDKTTGKTAVDFLNDVLGNDSGAYIYVTGHSLGGTLTPVWFAYLNAVLFNGNTQSNMAMWSFAGLTAGGTAFNDYINTFTSNIMNWRYHNTLDVAPQLFSAYTNDTLPAGITNLFDPLPIDSATEGLLKLLFGAANTSVHLLGDIPPGPGFYSQPQGFDYPVEGIFQLLDVPPEVAEWAAEAFYQHHATTYYQLVFLEYYGKG